MKMFLVLIGLLIFPNVGHLAASEPVANETENVSIEPAANTVSAALPKEDDTAIDRTIVGNKACPVDGKLIPSGTQAEYEFHRKIYNFCSLFCIEEFKQDPEKYLMDLAEKEKAAEKLAAQQAAAKAAAAAGGQKGATPGKK